MKRRDGVFHFAARVHRAERLIELPQLLYVVRVVEYFGCKRYITVVSRKRVKLRPLSRSREIVRIPLLARLEISGAPRDLNGQRAYIFTDTEPLQRSVKGFYKIGRNTESVQSLRKLRHLLRLHVRRVILYEADRTVSVSYEKIVRRFVEFRILPAKIVCNGAYAAHIYLLILHRFIRRDL